MNHLLRSWKSSIYGLWYIIFQHISFVTFPMFLNDWLLHILFETFRMSTIFWLLHILFETFRMSLILWHLGCLCEAIAVVMTITHSGPISLSIRIARLPSPQRRGWEVMTPFGADSGWGRHSSREIPVIFSSLGVSGAFVHYYIIHLRPCFTKRLIMIRNSQSYLGRRTSGSCSRGRTP